MEKDKFSSFFDLECKLRSITISVLNTYATIAFNFIFLISYNLKQVLNLQSYMLL